jgi:hypothetical protein
MTPPLTLSATRAGLVRDEDSTTDPALHFVADKPSVKVAVYAVPLAISDDQLLWWSGLLSHGGSSP